MPLTDAVSSVLISYREGLTELLMSQLLDHHRIVADSTKPSQVREAFSIREGFAIDEDVFHDDVLSRLKRRKMYRPIADCKVTECFNCCSEFGMFNRKHHCRACGRIFCHNCSKYTETVPEELIEYRKTKKWIAENSRVCKKCKENVAAFNSISHLLEYFRIVAYPFHLCVRAACVSRDWEAAMKIYLGGCHTITRSSLVSPLEEWEKRCLISNSKNCSGHNGWLREYLKVDRLPNHQTSSSCHLMDCYGSCSSDLDGHDALVILNSSIYPPHAKSLAMEIVNRSPPDSDLVKLLPLELRPVQEHVKRRRELFSDFFWLSRLNGGTEDNVFHNHLIIANPDNALQVQESLRLVSILDNYSLFTLNSQLEGLRTPMMGPFGPVESFDRNFVVKNSATRPIIIPYLCYGEKRRMLYKKDDVRRDLYVVSIINVLYRLLDLDERYLCTYRVVPSSNKSGFIEIVEDSLTIQEILSRGTISNYLATCNRESTFNEIVTRYSSSLCFWTVITYVLGIGDRHLENIMIRRDGVLFHIDYGFIFGRDSTSSYVRIDSDLIEGLGGMQMYEDFKQECVDLYIRLRERSTFIVAACLRLSSVRPALSSRFTPQFIEEFVFERLCIGQSEEEAAESFSNIVDASRDHIANRVSDAIHSTVASFKVALWE